MQKIVIAPDKFKGSLTGLEFCDLVEQGIKKHAKRVDVVKVPLADGGDGTLEVLQYYMGGERVEVEVHDPLMRKIKASYLYASAKKTAFIEMAEASGIRLLKNLEANPMFTSTYGTGELIADAISKGAQHIILGIGGSSTNDAGMGMARALNYHFYDKNGLELEGKGQDLTKLKHVDNGHVSKALKNVNFEVACDVKNSLYGPNGAAYIYAPQKGAKPKIVKELDAGLQNFNTIVSQQFNLNLQSISGAGAAGGMGAGCVLFLGAKLISGISMVKEIANFDKQIKEAAWIITGEGKLDKQTFSGKVIQGVMSSKSKQSLAIFCGISEINKSDLAKYEIDYLAEMLPLAKDIDDSIKNAAVFLEQAAEEFAKQKLLI